MLPMKIIRCMLIASIYLKNTSCFTSSPKNTGKIITRPSTSSNNRNNKPRYNNLRYNDNLSLSLTIPRGGSAVVVSTSKDILTKITQSPTSIFHSALASLALMTISLRLYQSREIKISDKNNDGAVVKEKPKAIKNLQMRFLAVFWLLRCADWLQGPYFYEVYASKMFNGASASLSLISRLFLVGFASTAVFGPFVGRLSDVYGRKKGTIAYTALYTIGALSTKSLLLPVLMLGRFVNGIGTSLLFSAPESWLVGEANKVEDGPEYLGETFGLAYAGDAIVAILAGQFAALAATQRGSTGPFELSVGFLILGAIMTTFLWKENVASTASSDNTSDDDSNNDNNQKLTIRDAIKVVKNDKKIMLVGAVQALFEAAMYIFVLQWPPAMTAAIIKVFGESAATPYGTVFSCFMASCLLGSTIFGRAAKKSDFDTQHFMYHMLTCATSAMGLGVLSRLYGATRPWKSLLSLIFGFFTFEACVGMYFPSIGTLRSKFIPDSHRSVIMNLFGIPLNFLVVSVFLSIKYIGVTGALGVSTGALALASLSMFKLKSLCAQEEKQTLASA